MKINRTNYEEYFLLYADNELSATDKKLVEAFVAENKDLAEEFSIMQGLKLSPEEFDFPFKAGLLKTVDAETNTEQLLLYIDGELNSETAKSVEEKISSDSNLANEYASLQKSKLPVEHIAFPDKQILYKKSTPVFVMGWLRYAVAAAVLVAGVWWAYRFSTEVNDVPKMAETIHGNKTTNPVTSGSTPVKEDALTNPVTALIEEEQPVKQQSVTAEVTAKPDIAKNEVEIKRTNVEKPDDVQLSGTVSSDAMASVADKIIAIEETSSPYIAQMADIKSQQTTGVKPLILDQSVFENNRDEVQGQEIAFNEVDNNEKSNRKMRGLLRRASRFVNGPESEKADVILIGGFEVAKK